MPDVLARFAKVDGTIPRAILSLETKKEKKVRWNRFENTRTTGGNKVNDEKDVS